MTGKIVAMFPGAEFGPLHYREIEKNKSYALQLNRGNYEANMSLDEGAKADLDWWVHNAHKVCLRINKGHYDLTLSIKKHKKGTL